MITFHRQLNEQIFFFFLFRALLFSSVSIFFRSDSKRFGTCQEERESTLCDIKSLRAVFVIESQMKAVSKTMDSKFRKK